MRITWLLMIVLLSACSAPARYIIISDHDQDVRWKQAQADRRLIWLATEDARKRPDILDLYTKADIEKYEKKHRDANDPVEGVLYHLIRADYRVAEELLNQHGDRIPAYVRKMVTADLASEKGTESAPATELMKLYQEAFDSQPCDIGRSIVHLRIRQVRYGR
jgi:hypothetical protein